MFEGLVPKSTLCDDNKGNKTRSFLFYLCWSLFWPLRAISDLCLCNTNAAINIISLYLYFANTNNAITTMKIKIIIKLNIFICLTHIM